MRVDKHKDFITEEERLSLIDWMGKNRDKYFVKRGQMVDHAFGDNSTPEGREPMRLSTRVFKSEPSILDSNNNPIMETRIDYRPNTIEFPEVAYEIQKRIRDKYNIPDDATEVLGFDGMVSVITLPGGTTGAHVDHKRGGHAVRFNVLLQEPDSGGVLIINREVVPLEERELHAYCATMWEHWVTEVEGDTERMLWIFGFEVGDDWE